MANTLAAVVPQILAQGLLQLKKTTVLPFLINRNYSNEAAAKGDTIDVPIASAISAAAVTAAATPPSTGDVTMTKVQISLNKWYEAPFYVTDKERAEAVNGLIPMEASAAISALAQQVNSDIFGQYKGVYGYVGTAGTTPFASSRTVATTARKTLLNQHAPMDANLRIVVDPDAEANALDLSEFANAGFTTDSGVILNAVIGHKVGFDWFVDQQVPTHTAGTITTGFINKASTAVAVGAKTLVGTTAASTGAIALKEGDIITIAGDTQTYAISADATEATAATDATITFTPGLKIALTGSEAISVKASHVVNLAFHRDAFALATRPLEAEGNGLGNIIRSVVDRDSGLTLRLEVSREHKRTRWSFDILYGVKLVRAELACRIAG